MTPHAHVQPGAELRGCDRLSKLYTWNSPALDGKHRFTQHLDFATTSILMYPMSRLITQSLNEASVKESGKLYSKTGVRHIVWPTLLLTLIASLTVPANCSANG